MSLLLFDLSLMVLFCRLFCFGQLLLSLLLSTFSVVVPVVSGGVLCCLVRCC